MAAHEEQTVSQQGATQAAVPSREDVVAAVQQTQDVELKALTADPDGFVVKATDMPDIKNHRVFRVLFTNTDHPMSFWLATDASGKNATVLSQHLPGVAALLRAEPALWSAADLPARFHDLFREQSVQSRVLDAPAATVDRTAAGLRLSLAVSSNGVNELWKVDVPTTGTATIKTETLP